MLIPTRNLYILISINSPEQIVHVYTLLVDFDALLCWQHMKYEMFQLQRISMQKDSPQQGQKFYLYSQSKKTKFEHYPIKPKVVQLLKDNNYKKPTLVQADSLPITLQDNLKNLCVIIYAYNGAGKTLTYLIPLLNSLQNIPYLGQKFLSNKDHQICRPQAVIVVPTEALLAQIFDYLQAYADFYQSNFNWTLKIGRIYSTYIEKGHILIGLARKMQENLTVTSKYDLSELKWVVFDECDKVKEDTLVQFSDMLKTLANPKINTSTANLIITSATGDKQKFRSFIQDNLTSHNILQLDSKDENKGLAGVTHFYTKQANKDAVIFNLLEKLSKIESKPQVIIFFNSIKQLRNFYALLKNERAKFVINNQRASDTGKNNINVDYIHGKCTAICRISDKDHIHPQDCSASKTIRVTKLRNKQIQVLLGTETIGRGIDIRTVTLVINYSEPKNKDELCPTAYIHRVGRTGRYSDQGIALTFVSSNIFIKLAQQEQKIQFQEMKSEDEILKLTVDCSLKNEKIAETDQHRYEYD